LDRFTRRDAEKGRLELVDPIDYSGRPSIALAGLVAIGMIEKPGSPPLGIDLPNCIFSGRQELPEFVKAVRSGKTTRCPDNSDRAVARRPNAASEPQFS